MDSTFFPPATNNIDDAKTETEMKADDDLDYDTEEEQATEATTEILSQLPDAPTDEPVDVDDFEEPSQKKQKTDEASDDDFVVIDKDTTEKANPNAEL